MLRCLGISPSDFPVSSSGTSSPLSWWIHVFFFLFLYLRRAGLVCARADASRMFPPYVNCMTISGLKRHAIRTLRDRPFCKMRRYCPAFATHCFLWSKVWKAALASWQPPALTGISPKCHGPALSSVSILSKAPWSIPRDLNAASKCENIGRCPIYQKRNNSTHSPLGSIWSTSDLLFVLFILSHLSAIQHSGHTAHTLKPRV